LVAVTGIASKAFLPKVVSIPQKPGWGVETTLFYQDSVFRRMPPSSPCGKGCPNRDGRPFSLHAETGAADIPPFHSCKSALRFWLTFSNEVVGNRNDEDADF
jgi:hypothetical protein